MRFVFLFILLYLLYRLIKVLLPSKTKRDIDIMPFKERHDEDEMEKDPCCNVYISKRNAYSANIKGEQKGRSI